VAQTNLRRKCKHLTSLEAHHQDILQNKFRVHIWLQHTSRMCNSRHKNLPCIDILLIRNHNKSSFHHTCCRTAQDIQVLEEHHHQYLHKLRFLCLVASPQHMLQCSPMLHLTSIYRHSRYTFCRADCLFCHCSRI